MVTKVASAATGRRVLATTSQAAPSGGVTVSVDQSVGATAKDVLLTVSAASAYNVTGLSPVAVVAITDTNNANLASFTATLKYAGLSTAYTNLTAELSKIDPATLTLSVAA